MKNRLPALLLVLLFIQCFGCAQLSFTVISSTGNFALTCTNNTLNLTASSPSGPPVSYTWTDPHGLSSAVNPYTVIAPGTYTVVASSGGQSSTQVVSIADNRIYPVVAAARLFTMSCPGGTVALKTTEQTNPAAMTYSWSSPVGAIASGNTTATLVTNAAGIYTIAVTNTLNGCTTNAFPTVWACVGLPEQESGLSAIRAFPNPTSGRIWFEAGNAASSDFKLTLINSLGQVLYEKSSHPLNEALDLSFLKNGIYQLSLQNEQGQKTVRLLKE